MEEFPYAPGGRFARRTDPITSRISGEGDYRAQKVRAAVLLHLLDRGVGFTNYELEQYSLLPEVQRYFGKRRPLGTCPWHRVTDCLDEGWAEVLHDSNGDPIARMGGEGKLQQVVRVTELGRVEARSHLGS